MFEELMKAMLEHDDSRADVYRTALQAEMQKCDKLNLLMNMRMSSHQQLLKAILATVGPLRIPSELVSKKEVQAREYSIRQEDGMVFIDFEVRKDEPTEIRKAH